MIDGLIELDSPRGAELGFISEIFDGWLWKKGNIITLSLIISLQEGQGNLSILFDCILEKGYTIHIPTPSNRMRAICESKGFKQRFIYDEDFKENVEIWEKIPKKGKNNGKN